MCPGTADPAGPLCRARRLPDRERAREGGRHGERASRPSPCGDGKRLGRCGLLSFPSVSILISAKAPPLALADPAVDWEGYQRRVQELRLVQSTGRVSQVVGLVVELEGPAAHLGDVCSIGGPHEPRPVLAEVVGFRRRFCFSCRWAPSAGSGREVW